jgi:chromosomal replication initiation ATPase DnaA
MSKTTKEEKIKLVFRRQDRIDYVMDGICNFYDITRAELLRKARSKERLKRKSITVKILRDAADCTLKDIMCAFNCSSQEGIWQIHSNITDDLEDRSFATKEIREEYNNVVIYLGL